jgi:prevent-host-death family protein
MKTVSVATLKSELSRYLRTVRAGGEIIVTTHDHAVAKLVPYTVNAGITIRPPRLPSERLRGIKNVQTLKPCDPLIGLLEDRARR